MISDNDLIAIDSSALIRIFRTYPKVLVDQLWVRFEDFFERGIFISHEYVYDELVTSSKQEDDLSKRVRKYRSSFKGVTYQQAMIVQNIVKEFPGLVSYKREKNEADPWLIALAHLEQKDPNLFNNDGKLYLLSEESSLRANRIPAVCKKYGLEHRNLDEFIEMNEWDIILK